MNNPIVTKLMSVGVWEEVAKMAVRNYEPDIIESVIKSSAGRPPEEIIAEIVRVSNKRRIIAESEEETKRIDSNEGPEEETQNEIYSDDEVPF